MTQIPKWSKVKPKFKEDCVLITANWFKWDGGYWDYTLFEIKRTEGYNDNDEPTWYWGIYERGGDEWGDLADLKADKYLLLPLLKNNKK